MDENLQVQQESAAEDWMNQQQSKLLEQEGTNEQEAKDVATQDMEEIQATSVPVFLLW